MRVLAAGAVRTRDLGGTATTTEFTDAICREIDGTERQAANHGRAPPAV